MSPLAADHVEDGQVHLATTRSRICNARAHAVPTTIARGSVDDAP
jgi:hypothetical protein